jgi:hypothetical protein
MRQKWSEKWTFSKNGVGSRWPAVSIVNGLLLKVCTVGCTVWSTTNNCQY